MMFATKSTLRNVVSVLLAVICGYNVPRCHSWSKKMIMMGLPHSSNKMKTTIPKSSSTTTSTTSTTTKHTTTRRQWFQQTLLSGAAAATTVATTTTATFSSPSPSNAACLPGDLSTDCIGVYKVPIDDAVLPYVGTPEALAKFAPDIKYVPPISSPKLPKEAWDIVTAQRLAADDIQTVILSGRLEEAGIKVLNLIPKVTSSGRVIVQSIKGNLPPTVVNDIRMERLQEQLDLALGLWGECDVMIGQGLRGQMGVSAVAQLQILTNLKEATAALDDFLALAVSAEKEAGG